MDADIWGQVHPQLGRIRLDSTTFYPYLYHCAWNNCVFWIYFLMCINPYFKISYTEIIKVSLTNPECSICYKDCQAWQSFLDETFVLIASASMEKSVFY